MVAVAAEDWAERREAIRADDLSAAVVARWTVVERRPYWHCDRSLTYSVCCCAAGIFDFGRRVRRIASVHIDY